MLNLPDALRELVRRNAAGLTVDELEQVEELKRRLTAKCGDFPSQIAFLATLRTALDELEGTR